MESGYLVTLKQMTVFFKIYDGQIVIKFSLNPSVFCLFLPLVNIAHPDSADERRTVQKFPTYLKMMANE